MPEPQPASGGGAPSRRGMLKKALTALLGVAFGLLLVEGVLRVYAVLAPETGGRLVTRDPFAAIYEPYGHYGYRPKPGRIERYSNRTQASYNSMRYRGPLVSVGKPPGTLRIILLGGSTAAGYGANDDETIDAYMRRLLAERLPTACVEVVSLALAAYDSYQDFERMRVDGARLNPDLVIIHSGINDVRHAGIPNFTAPPDRRTLIWEPALAAARAELTRRPGLWTVLKHYSYLARLPGYARERMGQRRELTAIGATEPYPAAVDYFETNVENTIKVADRVGAAVILSTPPSALSLRNKPTDPIEKSYWIRDAGTTEAYRERLALRMRDIAKRDSALGRRIRYVSHHLVLGDFEDDAHLLASGNATVARNLVEAAVPLLTAGNPSRSTRRPSCYRP